MARGTCPICLQSYSGDHCPSCGWFITGLFRRFIGTWVVSA